MLKSLSRFNSVCMDVSIKAYPSLDYQPTSRMAVEPGTTETKPESERGFIQPSQETSMNSDDSRSPSPKRLLHREGQPRPANREQAAHRNEHEPLEGPDEHEQLNIVESLESDEDVPTLGWLRNEDQMADLVLVLRWAQAYRVTIEGAGRMLKMQPEIVNRAVEDYSRDPNAREGGVRHSTRPVIKNWVRLGPL